MMHGWFYKEMHLVPKDELKRNNAKNTCFTNLNFSLYYSNSHFYSFNLCEHLICQVYQQHCNRTYLLYQTLFKFNQHQIFRICFLHKV